MDSPSELSEADDGLSTLLSESIDETMRDLLGEHATQVIYGYLEKHGVPRYRLAENLPVFDSFLEDKFGRGAGVIGREIAKRLCTHLGIEPVESPHFALVDYVEMTSRRLDDVEPLAD